ncbi:unnamed protein product [Cyclocybe aegerita]|uniref:Uncharacterized protein n=1 Tax=Cyclocybe aegerita TaxID=1973307 RepID=A0A8S0WID5_CYCAE|nr:unnamed protein product [Cyclocybe aegerita]
MSINTESSASQIAPAQVTESMGNLSINGAPDTADTNTNVSTPNYNPMFGQASLTDHLDGSAHNPITEHPSVGQPPVVQGIVRPVDFRGNLIPLFVPVAGFAYITRLDDFHFGILDPDTGKTFQTCRLILNMQKVAISRDGQWDSRTTGTDIVFTSFIDTSDDPAILQLDLGERADGGILTSTAQ